MLARIFFFAKGTKACEKYGLLTFAFKRKGKFLFFIPEQILKRNRNKIIEYFVLAQIKDRNRTGEHVSNAQISLQRSKGRDFGWGTKDRGGGERERAEKKSRNRTEIINAEKDSQKCVTQSKLWLFSTKTYLN